MCEALGAGVGLVPAGQPSGQRLRGPAHRQRNESEGQDSNQQGYSDKNDHWGKSYMDPMHIGDACMIWEGFPLCLARLS